MIVTLAINSKHYGELAANLVASIRRILPNERIVILSDGSYEKATSGFAQNVEVFYVPSGNPFKIKSRLHEYVEAPAIFIDADTVVNDDSAAVEAIKRLKESKLYIQQYGEISIAQDHKEAWVSGPTLFNHYKLKGIFPVFNSSIIAWGTGKKTFWNKAKAAYDNPCPLRSNIGGYFPDEVALGVASNKKDTQPDFSDNFLWLSMSKFSWKGVAFISMAGGRPNRSALMRYNGLVRRNSKQMGIPYFPLKPQKKIANFNGRR